MATHSSILAWKKIPWTEEAGGLQSLGSHRIKYCGETEQPCLPRTVLSCALYPLLHSYLSPVSSYKLTPVSVSGFGRMKSFIQCLYYPVFFSISQHLKREPREALWSSNDGNNSSQHFQ